MNHVACRQAIRDGDAWRCYGCGRVLADRLAAEKGIIEEDEDVLALDHDLVRLERIHDELRTFGPPERLRLRGEIPRHKQVIDVQDDGDWYVFCPSRACGRGQHLRLAP